MDTLNVCHKANNGLGWSLCEFKEVPLSSREIDEITCIKCLQKLTKDLTSRLEAFEKSYKTMSSGLHNALNEGLWAVGLLRLLIRETGQLHKDCPFEGKCLVLDAGFCWVRNYEAVIENKKKKK